MKNRFLLILACFLCSVSVYSQVEHAPTVAQCQADQRLWFSKIEEGDSPRLPTYDVLAQWDSEMTDCLKVDPSNTIRYYNTGGEIDAITEMRLEHFLLRHQLWQEFMAEDAAGKR